MAIKLRNIVGRESRVVWISNYKELRI